MRWLIFSFAFTLAITALAESTNCIVGEWRSLNIVTSHPFFRDKKLPPDSVYATFKDNGAFVWRGGRIASEPELLGTYELPEANKLLMQVNGESDSFRFSCVGNHLTIETPDQFFFVFQRFSDTSAP